MWPETSANPEWGFGSSPTSGGCRGVSLWVRASGVSLSGISKCKVDHFRFLLSAKGSRCRVHI